jgi:hypothetical protein
MISGVEYDLAYTNNEMYYRAAMEETTLLRDLKQAGVSHGSIRRRSILS